MSTRRREVENGLSANDQSPFPSRRQVLGWRCTMGFHRWRTRSICGREFGATEYHAWEIYEECERCGAEQSRYERHRRMAQAVADYLGVTLP